jgi:hypothetical protein
MGAQATVFPNRYLAIGEKALPAAWLQAGIGDS